MTTSRLIVRRRIGDLETPVSAMLKLGPDEPGTFLFESIAGGERLGRYSFIGLAPEKWFRIRDGVAETSADIGFSSGDKVDLTPTEALRSFVEQAKAETEEDLPPMASGAFGYVGYDMIQHVEPVTLSADDCLNVPEVLLVVPKVVLVFDHIFQEILFIGRVTGDNETEINELLDDVEKRLEKLPDQSPKDQPPQPVELTSNTSKETYFEIVEKCRDYIKAGDIFQVVPSQRLSTPFNYRSISYYRALRRLNPSAFMFHMNLGDVRLVGSSPEILVRVRDGRVAIRPIAGTRPRTGDPMVDAEVASGLLADPKEMAEHLMLLDLGRNDVGRVAAYGSVEVTESFIVETYSHVMHIVSHVEGDLRAGLDSVDALFAGFPAGTVSGAPKIRAMQIIDEMESEKRGIYGGAVGYFGWNGDLDTCIALRTAVIKDETLYIQAGGGVVLDSIPQYEYDETLHKAGALKRAAELSASYEFDQ